MAQYGGGRALMAIFGAERQDDLCPRCRRVMVDLRDFDARDDAFGVEDEPVGFGYHYGYYERGLWDLCRTAWEWLTACLKQRRLNRVLRQWPNSLYCPGCGFLIRRR